MVTETFFAARQIGQRAPRTATVTVRAMKKIATAALTATIALTLGSGASAADLDINENAYAYADSAGVEQTTNTPTRIEGYALRAAVEAEERSLVWYERLDSIEDTLNIEMNPYAYELTS